jgi:hypothetical protein
MILPQSTIDEINRQTARNLWRFDISFDIPEIFIPEFPPAIFLTTRPDLGDVSQRKVVTFANFFELFKDALNQKQLDGFRLLPSFFSQLPLVSLPFIGLGSIAVIVHRIGEKR